MSTVNIWKRQSVGTSLSKGISQRTNSGRYDQYSAWIKERFEIHHGVNIHDNALVAAATLSDRYITDRFLPDKAIDLIDEASATIRVEMNSMPTELDQVTRRLMQLEIEEAALKKNQMMQVKNA